MNKIETFILVSALALAQVSLSPAAAIACCTVCFGPSGDKCYEFESSCKGICGSCSCVNSINVRNDPQTDYILALPGQSAYIVNGQTRIKIAPDNMAAFMKKMNLKYPSATRNDPAMKTEISAAWDNFFRQPINTFVSPKRLAIISKETGLRIVSSTKRAR